MAAAMSVIAIPEMKKRGYPDWLSGGLVATAGGIAILIPPSIPLIYGLVTETSVVRLFFAGVIPGLMLALGNIIIVIIIALWPKLPRGEAFNGRRVCARVKAALAALGMPVIILGGLYGGVFTPTGCGRRLRLRDPVRIDQHGKDDVHPPASADGDARA